MHADIAEPQVVVTKCQSIFENLIQLDRDALGLVLASEAEQVLNDAVSPLRLLVKLIGILHTLGSQLAAGEQQLAVAQNSRQRIIEFVSDTRNELAHSSHFLAMQQLLLSAPQILISLTRLFIQH